MDYPDTCYAQYRASLHLYDDAIILDRPGGSAYLVDPQDLTTAVSGLPVASGLLPRNCLFWSQREGQERIGILVEPQVWAVSVQGQALTWFVPMPALVFIGHGLGYSLYALKEAGWPEATTRLYHAPCPNVDYVRGVCIGNVPFQAAGRGTIWQSLEFFFTSGFNRDLGNGKSKKYNDDVLRMWRVLNRVRAGEYPLDDLVPAGVALGDVAGGM